LLVLGLIGLILEALGIVIVLGSQVIFILKARKKYGSLGTAFLEIQATRIYMDDEKVQETVKDKQKLKKAFGKFPHAELLYDNFKYSVVGLEVSFLGLVCQLIDLYFLTSSL